MSETDAIAKLIAHATAAQRVPIPIETMTGRTFIALPGANDTYTLTETTLPNGFNVLMPAVVTAAIKLQTTQSLVEYTNRFKNQNSMLFADIDRDTIVSIIDYHTESGADEKQIQPKLASHRATLTLPKAQEWKIWNEMSGKLVSHKDFASFLEENSIDIVEPVGGELLELCRDLQVINNVNFSSAVRDGDYTSVAFAKENDATSKGNIKLPQSILLGIPVYFGEESVHITAFLRKKIDDSGLHLGIKLSRAENVRQAEFHRIVEKVTINVDHLTTVYGTSA